MLIEIQFLILFFILKYKTYIFGITIKYIKPKKISNMQIDNQIGKSDYLTNLLSLNAFFLQITFSLA